MLLTALALASPPPVVGGAPSPPGRWPEVVALYSGAGEEPICTGTLIAPDLVLSAEHCYGITHGVIGALDPDPADAIPIVERFDHPDAPQTYDIAVFRLETPSSTPPRPVLVDCLADFYFDGAPATVAGYGLTAGEGSPPPRILHEAPLSIVDADCGEAERGCRVAVSPGGELIAGGDGVDSCIGDSGGPMFLDTGEATYLAGVVSRGALPATQTCGDGGIYVRTDAIVPWIEATTGATLPRPASCEGTNRPPVVAISPVRVTQGRRAALDVSIADPDPSDTHSVAVIEGPDRGTLTEGLVFVAEPFQVGPDRVVLEVTDSGEPSRTVRVEVPIAVFPAGHLDDPVEIPPGGCATAPGPGLGGFSRR